MTGPTAGHDPGIRERRENPTMTLDPLLIDVLACPEDKGSLWYFADENILFNPRLHRTYPVRDGIPVMLIDEATAVDGTESARLVAKSEDGQGVLTGGAGQS